MIKKKTLVQNFLLAIGSIILFFTLLEVGTRLLWRVEVQKDHVGVVLEKGNRKITHEGVQYKTNSLGLRNKEIQRDKPAGTKRILALGDSFTWGDGLPEEGLVTVKIEDLLNNKNANKVDVINGGISGFNTDDEFEQLVRLTPIYDPDMLIVFFFTNDILETTGKGKNHYVISRRQRIKETLVGNSRFCAYLYCLYKGKYVSKIGMPQFMLPADYFNLDDSKPGWVAFKSATLDIKNYCQQNDIGFLFIMIPTLTNLGNNYPYKELHEKVVEFITFNNIHLIDLFYIFAPYQPKDLWIRPDNSHWNGKATTIAANEIANYIKNYKLLE